MAGTGSVTGFTSNQATVTISGHVPLICRVNFAGGDGAFNQSGVARLGTTTEFCNDADGYRLYASASHDADPANLIVGGRAVALVPGADVMIFDSQGPASASRSIDYHVGEGGGGGSVTLRIEAK
ncbi:MAG: hypothetical protein HC777_01395 [Hyphomonadaceae bacterium]|nr:hypothetical protein [Hyphomonadaceae bacterium]